MSRDVHVSVQGHAEEDIQGSHCQAACRSVECTLGAEIFFKKNSVTNSKEIKRQNTKIR